MRDLPDAAGRGGQRGSGMREEIDGMQQSEGVGAPPGANTTGLAFGRQDPYDPGIATLFLGFMKLAARPPNDRMPPIDGHHGHFEEPHPMIAAAQVGQLMNQQGRALLGIEPVQQLGGKQ